MLLRNVHLENFKSIKSLDLPIAPITILIGPNNSGKSSVLQALAVLKQSYGNNVLRTAGNLINIGEFSDVVMNHDEDSHFTIGVGGSIPLRKHLGEFGSTNEIELSFTYSQDARFIYHSVGGIRLSQFSLVWDQNFTGGPIQAVSANYGNVPIGISNLNLAGYISLGVTSIPGGAHEVVNRLNSDLQIVNNALGRIFNDIVLIPALRGQDQLGLELAVTAPVDYIDAQGHKAEEEKTIAMAAFKRQVEDKVTNWQERISGLTVRVRLMEQKRVTLEATTRNELTTNIVNQGFGSNQLSYMLIPIAAAPRWSTVGIEEPEVHLHPDSQASLAEILTEEALGQGKHLIITTHSDYFLGRLLTMVAEGKLKRTDLKVVNFEIGADQTTTTKELLIDEKGRISGGLPPFFKANVEMLKRYNDALLGHGS